MDIKQEIIKVANSLSSGKVACYLRITYKQKGYLPKEDYDKLTDFIYDLVKKFDGQVDRIANPTEDTHIIEVVIDSKFKDKFKTEFKKNGVLKKYNIENC